MMLLAATESLTWARRQREEAKNEPVAIHSADQTSTESAIPADDRLLEPLSVAPESLDNPSATPAGSVAAGSVDEPPSVIVLAPDRDPFVVDPYVPGTDFEQEEHVEDTANPVVKQAKDLWKQDNPSRTLKEQRRLLAEGVIDHLPWEDYLDDPRIERAMTVSTIAPDGAIKGDMWADISRTPTHIMKFNGVRWIEVDKNLSDQYAYDDAYIDYLVNKISSGEYDPDLLTDSERSQIEDKLRRSL